MSSPNYLAALVTEYLKTNGIAANNTRVHLALQSDPSFPSLLSIKQTCNYIGLNPKAFKGDYDALLKVTMPVIAHINEGADEKFVLVRQVQNEKVVFYDFSLHKRIEVTKEAFCQQWTGVFLYAEKSDHKEPTKTKNQIGGIWLYGFVLLALGGLLFFSFGHSLAGAALPFTLVLLFLKGTGVWLTMGLVKHQFSQYNRFFDSLCKKGSWFDCDKVLSSSGSVLFNNVHLADVGFVYFVTGLFAFILAMVAAMQLAVLTFLLFLSVSGLPVVFFSVVYQKFVVKKWCPLCLGVIGLIMLEAGLFVFLPYKTIQMRTLLPTSALVLISLVAGICLLVFYKKLLKAQGSSFKAKLHSLRLKRSPAVIIAAFNQQKRIERPRTNCLVFGNSDAPIVLTTLLSPMCKPCKKAALEIVELMQAIPDLLCWQIRFDGVEDNEYDKLNHIQLSLIQLCNNKTEIQAKLQIIKDWYNKQSYQWFFTKHKVDSIAPENSTGFYLQLAENKALGLSNIPAVWINNRVFPTNYNLLDIRFLINELNLLLNFTK